MDFKAVVDFGVPFLLYKSVPHKISIIEDNEALHKKFLQIQKRSIIPGSLV